MTGSALGMDPRSNTSANAGSDQPRAQVGSGQWASEMVLWMSWIHRGSLMAITQCELVNLDAVTFHEHVKHRQMVYEMCRRYAHFYLEEFQRVTETQPGTGSFPLGSVDDDNYPTDIWGFVDEV